jgi:hypothetical protein
MSSIPPNNSVVTLDFTKLIKYQPGTDDFKKHRDMLEIQVDRSLRVVTGESAKINIQF